VPNVEDQSQHLRLVVEKRSPNGRLPSDYELQKGSGHKISHWERFEEFVKAHGGKTQSEMARLWGDNVTQQNISNALKKLGLSRKKRRTVTNNQMS
jgi:hypothetical protein